jgi:general secretion pathway protein G
LNGIPGVHETQPNAPTGNEGWTFLETLIVMGIVLILTSSVGLLGFRYIAKARIVAARTTVESLSMAIDSYYLDCGQYPSVEQGLSALWEKPVMAPLPDRWQGPYVSKPVASDPWGTPYVYRVPGPSGLPYGVVSYGADGVPGGEMDAADVASWRS